MPCYEEATEVFVPGGLSGIRVLEVASHLSGPYAGMLLADHGADVVKVEPPGGDDLRDMPPFVNGESAPFTMWNCNKRSVQIDLKDNEGKRHFCELADRCDVVVENYRVGTLDRLGVGWKVLSERNPRLIYGAVSGFGRTGPDRDKGGFDLVVQGMSGLMASCGPADGPPHRLPLAISDLAAGMFLTIGILIALEARHRTGRGQLVETSLLEAAVSLGVYEAAHYFATQARPPKMGQAHRGASPYQVFETMDGFITVGAGSQRLWQKLCETLDLIPLITDVRFLTNADRVRNNDALVELLQSVLRRKSTSEWLDGFARVGIPGGPVLWHDEILKHPQIIARDMVVRTSEANAFPLLGIPVKLSETPGSVCKRSPRLGEHTDAVFNGQLFGEPSTR